MFEKAGFVIGKEARVDTKSLSSFSSFRETLKFADIFRLLRAGRIQTTWRLKPKPVIHRCPDAEAIPGSGF